MPFNIPIENFVSGLGKKKHKSFKMGVGEWSPEEFQRFADTFTGLCADHLEPGGAFFSCADWRCIDVVLLAAKRRTSGSKLHADYDGPGPPIILLLRNGQKPLDRWRVEGC